MSDSSCKRLFLGIDEAGYGPNLGPLLIGASAWLAPAHMDESELIAAVSPIFQPTPFTEYTNHLPLGDSKRLFQPRGGLATLELGTLSMFNLQRRQIAAEASKNLQSLLAASAEFDGDTPPLPWYYALEQFSVPQQPPELPSQGHPQASPLRGNSPELIEHCTRLGRTGLDSLGIELLDMRGIVITEPSFNRRVAELGSKGQLLTLSSLSLVAELLGCFRGEPVEVYCDRHGGRRNYLPLLFEALPDTWFSEIKNSPQRCSYRGSGRFTCDIHFSVGGDSFPPTALASMLAKYLRERLMESFNRFWSQQLPDIRPTAGYPADAQRFRRQIELRAAQLGLAPELWWRSR